MKIQGLLIASAAALLSAAPAFASVMIGTSTAVQSQTNGWAKTGQTFTTTGAAHLLQDWTVNSLSARNGAGSLSFSIHEWNGSTPGAQLYSKTVNWSTTSTGPFSITDINLDLTAGKTYAAVFDFLGYTGASTGYTSDSYAGGSGIWFNSGSWNNFTSLDSGFQARFGESVLASTVPEPSSLALLSVAALGLLAAKRRRKV